VVGPMTQPRSLFKRFPSFGGARNTPDGRASDADEALLLLKNFEESGQGWLWSTDHEGRVTYLTESVSRLFCSERETLLGSTFADLFVKAEDEGTRRTLPFILVRQSRFEKLVLRSANAGEERWWSISGSPQHDAGGRFTGYRGSGVEITEQRRSSEHASQLAMYDSLTGLPNRLRMSEVLEANLAGCEPQKRSCAVMLIDLDRFKQVNDTLGHPAGDALLKQVAARLLRTMGDKDKVFRIGGDEFQIILRDSDDRAALGDIATDIIASLSQPYSVDGSRCIIGASIGIAVGPADGRTSDDLIRNADLALYEAKGSGRGRFRCFSTDLLEAAEDKRLIEEDLRDALAKGEIHLAYQPIVDAATNCQTGVEALIRWHHPERGLISPALFIPIAEEANLIEALGEWVLRKACEDAAKWPGKLRVAVNVSPIQFTNEALPRIVLSALAASGLSPERLELEITEGVFLAEAPETDTMFATLKKIGVRLALDDFGTGYSSLGYLRKAPFDKIKIDQSFVRAATLPGSRNGAIIAAIVALAGALEMETTAEGIESLDQLQLIRNLGVSHVQGYVYSKAVSSDELNRRLIIGDWVLSPSGPARQRSDRQAMYRKAGAICGNRYQPVLIRNLSDSGALIEGLLDASLDAPLLIDFGDGHLAFARVRRATARQQGIAFDEPLVTDGSGGLSTAHRVSPYLLGTLGLPTPGRADAASAWEVADALPIEELAKKLGLSLAPARPQPLALSWSGALAGGAKVLPGPIADGSDPASRERQGFPPSEAAGASQSPGRDGGLTPAEVERLLDAVKGSHNRQLKFIVSLLMVTGVRQGELIEARWADIDLENAVWHLPTARAGDVRDVPLSRDALDLIGELPRWEGCPYVIANPTTKKPFRSLSGSWEAARNKAGLPHIEINDLRDCTLDAPFGSHHLDLAPDADENEATSGTLRAA
jgi:diguanylate cyclase (GGDEF)-like protein/PAS domain S-box-containing protein